jgi:histidyl-tRNA synthetase
MRSEVVERFLWKMGRSEQRRQILHALAFLRELHMISGSPPTVFDDLRDLLSRYELDEEPLRELQQLVTILEQSGVSREQIVLNLSLGRGVSYYTGLVFEIHTQEENGFDTQLCGGGRYDRLLRAVGSTRAIGACGFAFGVERLVALVPESEERGVKGIQALVIPVGGNEFPYALEVARYLREIGMRTEVDITEHGVGAGLKLADKRRIPLAVIVGESERVRRVVTVRQLMNGEEQVVNIDELARVQQMGMML